jgi:hypothetical protein
MRRRKRANEFSLHNVEKPGSDAGLFDWGVILAPSARPFARQVMCPHLLVMIRLV